MSVTLSQIASKANVSPITVSRALRGIGRVKPSTRKRVREVASSLGYQRLEGVLMSPAVCRGTGDHCLRLLIPVFAKDRAGITPPFGTRVLDGLRRRLLASGGKLVVRTFGHVDEVIEAWPKLRPHGIVLRQTLPRKWVERLRRMAPVVYAVSHDCQSGVDSVYTSEHRSAAMILDYLSGRGHREIAWFSILDHHRGDYETAMYDDTTVVDRQAASIVGVRHAAWANLAYCQTGRRKQPLILVERDWRYQDLDEVVADGVGQILHLRPQPTAIVVSCDPIGLSVLRTLQARGIRVPAEMSVVSYGGTDEAKSAEPPLTTVELPMEDVGRVIPELIERRIANPDAAAMSIQFETTLFEGATVAHCTRRSQFEDTER